MADMLTVETPAVTRAVSRTESAHGLHVLVADAGATLGARIEQLRAAGYRVSRARTAFEALVKATCHLPDMILVDCALPEPGALETIGLLNGCPVTAHIPVAQLASGRSVPQRILNELRRRAR